jgi:hypothetical protein
MNIDEIVQKLEDRQLFHEKVEFLPLCDSYERIYALVLVLPHAPTPTDVLKIFLDWWSYCDAPWPERSHLSEILRTACAKVAIADLLPPNERAFYDSLPDVVPVWRGCERGHERGMSWTTDRSVAERFAIGKRCVNHAPTLVRAEIPKEHILGVFCNRNEREIVLDFRRLRNLKEI